MRYFSAPAASISTQMYALKPGRVIWPNYLVPAILYSSAAPQIGTLIIQAVTIFVVNILSSHSSRNETVHVHGALINARCHVPFFRPISTF